MNVWKHGKYVDTWSFVHFLSGFLLAVLFYTFSYSFLLSLAFSLLLLIAWEFFEWAIKIIEPSPNVIMDLVVGLLGFFAGSYVFYFMKQPFNPYFYIILIITILLSIWGFTDFLKKGYR